MLVSERVRKGLKSSFFEKLDLDPLSAPSKLMEALSEEYPSATKDELFEIWIELVLEEDRIAASERRESMLEQMLGPYLDLVRGH